MKLLSSALLFTGIALFSSCGNNANKNQSGSDTASTTDNAMTNDTGGTANATNTTTPTYTQANLDTMDKTFVMKAASGSMAEIQMANMAMQNSQNDRVKAFASMMIRDHSKASDELKAMAPNKGVTLPTQPMAAQMKHIDMLKGKTGSAFDKMYLDHMVMDHKEDVGDFKKASTNAKDADVKAFASRNLPVLQTHLDSAQAISKMKM